MQFRSVNDLGRTISSGLPKLPRSIDLVVGIPRSGMLAATLIALLRNLPLTDIDGLVEGRIFNSGTTRDQQRTSVLDVSHILLVDDSCRTGEAMIKARAIIDEALPGLGYTTCVAYGVPGGDPSVHITLETLAEPRIFEWNVLHHPVIERACVGIDGVLCVAPTEEEASNIERYEAFLNEATPYHHPGRKIGMLVSGRSEKYRLQTEAWLARNNIQYRELHMFDAHNGGERRTAFKARAYSRNNSPLFIEGEGRSAAEIARLSGKPVLSIEGMQMLTPGVFNLAALRQTVTSRKTQARIIRSLFGARGLEIIRKFKSADG